MHFDVVIVGGGAAGCALAHRLTADPDIAVLLLEAGPDVRPDEVAVPARWPETLFGPLDYRYQTIPQSAANDAIVIAPRGRLVGGTTCINAMIYSRPGPDDLATWGPGWSYDDCADALHAMESHRGAHGAHRGTDGPARNGPARITNPLCVDFVQASVEAGYPLCTDLNAPDAQGAGWFDLSIDDNGRRADAAQVYLRDGENRPNLSVWSNTTVTRLLLEEDRVVALDLIRDGAAEQLSVSGEVVLAAGAIDTPALLLRSGIGPADHLRDCGITARIDLPGVGRNLHDHPSVAVVWSSAKPLDPPHNQFAETNLLLRHPAATGGQTISVAWHHIAIMPPESEPPPYGATALIGLYEPRSRGRLTLDPANPSGPPLIDPRYLSDDRDAKALAAGITLVREIGQQQSLKPYGLTELRPGSDRRDSDALEDFVRHSVTTYGHPVGTCALGDGDLAVVDRHLRVQATANLRIADASVVPTIPQVAPSATVQMIGWRAADIITSAALRA